MSLISRFLFIVVSACCIGVASSAHASALESRYKDLIAQIPSVQSCALPGKTANALHRAASNIQAQSQQKFSIFIACGSESYSLGVLNRIVIGSRFLVQLSEPEIAFLLGHEASHLKHKDQLARFDLIDSIAPVQDPDQYEQVLKDNWVLLYPSIWDQEIRADSDSLNWLTQAGYAPLEALNIFTYMSPGLDHPDPADRLDRLLSQLKDLKKLNP